MKVALLLKNRRKDKLKDFLSILIFTIIDGRIEGATNEYLHDKDSNYFSLWLLQQQVKIIYVQRMDEKIKAYYENLNIEVRTYEEMKEHPLFKSFIF